MEKDQIEKAFGILFAGFYREMALIVKALEKATYHWNNVAATYSQMCEGRTRLYSRKVVGHFIS